MTPPLLPFSEQDIEQSSPSVYALPPDILRFEPVTIIYLGPHQVAWFEGFWALPVGTDTYLHNPWPDPNRRIILVRVTNVIFEGPNWTKVYCDLRKP